MRQRINSFMLGGAGKLIWKDLTSWHHHDQEHIRHTLVPHRNITKMTLRFAPSIQPHSILFISKIFSATFRMARVQPHQNQFFIIKKRFYVCSLSDIFLILSSPCFWGVSFHDFTHQMEKASQMGPVWWSLNKRRTVAKREQWSQQT